jgi:phosphomannomutase
MSQQPQLTVSGYRGVWGDTLTAKIAREYAKAFVSLLQENSSTPTVLLGRDGRESGLQIKEAIIEELDGLGINYIDGDIMPTPTVLFAVRKHGYDGAIIITASHNPIEYNGLKFVTDKALFIDEEEVEKIKEYYDQGRSQTSEREDASFKGSTQADEPSEAIFQQENMRAFQTRISSELAREHADHILKNINLQAIRARKFKVAVDMINASACVLDPYLFEQLGAELIPLNNIPNGKFTHKPEPLKENLSEIAELVKTSAADIGFAHDPDADRLVVIDEHGIIISEEHTLALGVENVLSKHPGNDVVINMSTSQMNCDIAKKYGARCIRTKVGEAYVVQGILDNKALIGGEGTGSSIYPTINTARDSFVSLALVLELLAMRNQTASVCVATLPKYTMRKDKLPVAGNLQEMYAKMKSHFSDATINELDGLRLDFTDSSWIHLRPSNTEPIVRLYGEARTPERLDALFAETKSLFA